MLHALETSIELRLFKFLVSSETNTFLLRGLRVVPLAPFFILNRMDAGEKMEKKKVNKKSIEYVRPEPGSFDLKAFPGHVFKFKKIVIDDEAWVMETFGKPTWEVINSKEAMASDLCRLYFHFLEDQDKAKFPPEQVEEMNYETGVKGMNLINGPKKFMRAIDGGSLTEMMLIAHAFLKTLIASRPISDLPDDLKKSVLGIIEKGKKKTAPKEEKELEANP